MPEFYSPQDSQKNFEKKPPRHDYVPFNGQFQLKGEVDSLLEIETTYWLEPNPKRKGSQVLNVAIDESIPELPEDDPNYDPNAQSKICVVSRENREREAAGKPKLVCESVKQKRLDADYAFRRMMQPAKQYTSLSGFVRTITISMAYSNMEFKMFDYNLTKNGYREIINSKFNICKTSRLGFINRILNLNWQKDIRLGFKTDWMRKNGEFVLGADNKKMKVTSLTANGENVEWRFRETTKGSKIYQDPNGVVLPDFDGTKPEVKAHFIKFLVEQFAKQVDAGNLRGTISFKSQAEFDRLYDAKLAAKQDVYFFTKFEELDENPSTEGIAKEEYQLFTLTDDGVINANTTQLQESDEETVETDDVPF
jgi:hypothetical protein